MTSKHWVWTSKYWFIGFQSVKNLGPSYYTNKNKRTSCTCGLKSIRYFGSKLSNSLGERIRTSGI